MHTLPPPYSSFVCPLDGAALESVPGAMRCGAGHTFDLAREGYLNLLLVQHKASRDPGDNKAMVIARRRILDSGFFAPVAEALIEVVREVTDRIAGAGPAHVVDAGCGEGYYLQRLVEAAQLPMTRSLVLSGIDISKWAVRAAAKRNIPVAWAVASNRHLPLARGSVHLILSLFGFPVWASFAHVQAAHGYLLLADAGPDHLLELRSLIYPSVERRQVRTLDAAYSAGYALEREWSVQYSIELSDPEQIQAMLAMTPHMHRISAEGRAVLAESNRQQVSIDVVYRLLCRH